MREKGISALPKTLQVYFQTVVIWYLGIIIFLFGASAALIFSIFDRWMKRPGDYVHLVSRYFGRSILMIAGIKVEVEGAENLNKDRAQLICPNHQSLFDIFILDSFLPTQFRFILKQELLSIPILGHCLRLEHGIAIDRKSRKSGVEGIRKAENLIIQGRSILIFPEGTRSLDGKVKEFKRGSLLIAIHTKAPIVPVTIDGTIRIMSKNSLLIYPQKVRLVIHPPISTEGLSKEEQKGLAEKVRQVIVGHLSMTLNQISSSSRHRPRRVLICV